MGSSPLPFYIIWELLQSGVLDVFIWEEKEQLTGTIAARIKRHLIVEQVLHTERVKKVLIGSSWVWRKVLRQVVEVASFSDAPVLILGETGTGKELIARLIHDLDQRPEKEDLILLDCSAIVPELFGSEFFGHEKGSYTNAVSVRDGAFALAHRGTLFLDELGELPLNLQAALLRVIQEGSYKRVGGNVWKKTDFRLIAATNRVLTHEIEERRFRSDLYYRISTFVIRLPLLEERREDIPELVRHFLCQILKTEEPPRLGKHLRQYLLTRKYPGNIRELRQVINRLVQSYTGLGKLTIGHLPAFERTRFTYTPGSWQGNGFATSIRQALADGVGLKDIKRLAGDVALELAVSDANGHLPTAAQRLGVSERLVQGWWAERKSEG
ncbi:MAG: sigma-54-dependent Fis family transcriptional regulator [Bacteroidetes bacterium]|nr:sigma-54-dependent Fis family transcriptional regulator [Bacteroidota bacterium]